MKKNRHMEGKKKDKKNIRKNEDMKEKVVKK